MFKKILKGRHEAPAAQKDTKPPQHQTGGPGFPGNTADYRPASINPVMYHNVPGGFPNRPRAEPNTDVSIAPVSYNESGPGGHPPFPGASASQRDVSINPVSYNQSAPGGPPPGPTYGQRPQGSFLPVEYRTSGPGNPQARPVGSAVPVEYVMSPLPSLAPPQASHAPTSPAPVDYGNGKPMSPPVQGGNPQPQRSPGLPPQQAYEYRAYQPTPQTPQQQWPTDPNTKYAYLPPPSPRAHEMPAFNSPAELPASAIAPRYEMPATNSAHMSPPPQYSSPRLSPRPSERPGWTSPTNTATTFGSTTTLVPSPRSGPASPMLGDQKTGWGAPPASGQQTQSGGVGGNDGIKKYVVDIYCPLKRDAQGNRREQIPRDVREFRLAKVALIPIVAGKRSFVSLDVVFGEVDKAFADLAEKHFSLCSRTQFMKLDPHAVAGGQVYSIGPLNIAYRDGDQSTVYVKFHTQEAKDHFKADYFEMWRYVEQSSS